MKHASSAALDRLDGLLLVLRGIDGLKEKSRGVFYRGGRAFLHFHEHDAHLFADVRFGSDFERWPVSRKSEQRLLLRAVLAFSNDGKKNGRRTG
jgi:hypothetical protein